jgi:hypothetical protein
MCIAFPHGSEVGEVATMACISRSGTGDTCTDPETAVLGVSFCRIIPHVVRLIVGVRNVKRGYGWEVILFF